MWSQSVRWVWDSMLEKIFLDKIAYDFRLEWKSDGVMDDNRGDGEKDVYCL